MKSSMMIILFPILILSPLIALSMNSWFAIWMILELNLMAFIPFIIFFNEYFKEMSMKYFIIQASSSSVFIFFSILNSMNYFINNNKLSLLFILLINLTILMKLGASPFHNWFINLMKNLNWLNCFILSTWQKIIPLILLSLNYNKFMILFFSLLSSLISGILGNNHQSIRIIMAYSSINNLSWMMIILMFSNNLLILYFNLYFMMNLSLMYLLNYYNFYYINQMNMMKIYNMKKFFLMNFFSMANLPPFFGFLLKWSSIFIFSMKVNNMLMIMLILMSLLSFLFYTRIIMSMMILYKFKNKMNFLKLNLINNNKLFKILIFCSPLNLWLMNSWIL